MGALSALSLLLVSLLSGLSGGAQFGVRGFSFTGVRNRLISPNGDGRNDKAFFMFSNPRDSAGTLIIYDSRGHQVASVDIPSGATTAAWDAGSAASGIYIYALTIEQTTVSGTLAVIR